MPDDLASGLLETIMVATKPKEILNDMQEAMSLFQPNQVLLTASLSTNSSANGYTQNAGEGLMTSKTASC